MAQAVSVQLHCGFLSSLFMLASSACLMNTYGYPSTSLASVSRSHTRVKNRYAFPLSCAWSIAPVSAQENFPALDRCRAQQPQRRPRIVREPDLDGLLTVGSNDEQELLLPVTKSAAQDDESVVCECVHKRGVLLPLLLLAHWKSGVPILSPFSENCVVGRGPLRHEHLLVLKLA